MENGAGEAKPNAWRRLRDWAVSEPLRALGLLALVAYVELLVPTELFYRTLGTTPADAGLAGIEVLLQQAALMLASYVLIGAGWAGGYFVLMYPFVVAAKTRASLGEDGSRRKLYLSMTPTVLAVLALALAGYAPLLFDVEPLPLALASGVLAILGLFMPRIVFSDAGTERKAAHRAAIDWGRTVAIGGLAFGATMLLFISIVGAIPYANQIKTGKAPDDMLFPWQARHVEVTWKSEPGPLHLPPCDSLIYLGEDDGRVLLYDSDKSGRSLRITSSDLELSFPENC